YILSHLLVLTRRPPPRSTLFPYTTLFRSAPLRFAAHPARAGQEFPPARRACNNAAGRNGACRESESPLGRPREPIARGCEIEEGRRWGQPPAVPSCRGAPGESGTPRLLNRLCGSEARVRSPAPCPCAGK